MTLLDLEQATFDARYHATDIYKDVYAEYTALLDHNRTLQPAWRGDARRDMARMQERTISDLEEKLSAAPDS
ncbi:hypothetical protein QP727_09120, partial [Lactobacillus jensenii]|nr:hypothetical protein [Lactobacillus jensenii]